MEKEKLVSGFKRIFKDGGDIRGYFAPGRVNLIGEHIDYNGGHVFPCALKNGNYVVARRREDKKIRFFSENFRRKTVLTSSLEDLSFKKEDLWTNYPKGVFYEFQKKGLSIPNGFDIYVSGDIPGSGLSSSAAMEIVIGTMLEEQFGFGLTPIEIALLGQKSENEYNGCSCGIMDQFASAMGKEGQAIFLDCKTLSYQYVPLSLKDYVIVVTNSNKPHSLTQSHYNDRRKECEEALWELQKSIPVSSLCELTPEQYYPLEETLSSPVLKARARFAVEEEVRTKEAVKALQNSDFIKFGNLLNKSGDGLRYQYDATCFEIDALVDAARSFKDCLGSRETGGGWGGNTISLVRKDKVLAFASQVGKAYFEKTGLHAKFNALKSGDGGRRIF